jgi:hypothetical protein
MSPRWGKSLAKFRALSCGTKATVLCTSVPRLWSIVFKCRLCRSGNVAVYVERENLPRASFQYLVATEPAVEHEAALAWAVSFAGDVVVGPHLADGDWKRENRRRFLAGQRGNAFELSKQRIESARHVRLPLQRRERDRSLSHRRLIFGR